jgi:hypothetical protein
MPAPVIARVPERFASAYILERFFRTATLLLDALTTS